MNIDTREITLEPADNARLLALCGPFDDNIKQLERRLGIEINRRDNHFKLTGRALCVHAAADILRSLYVDTAPMRGQIQDIEPEQIHLAIKEARVLEQSAESVPEYGKAVNIKTKRGVIKPRIKSFANEKVEMKKFRQGNERFVNSKKLSYKYMGTYNSGMGAFTTLITISVLLTGAFYLTKGAMPVEDLVTVLLYINNFTDPVKKLITFTEQFQNGYSGYSRFLEIMAVAPDIQDAPEAKEVNDVKGAIDFENVSFAYEGTQEKVLSHVNLKVKAGEYVALVGSSGAGKTTLCSLIPRFYDVTEGSVLLDGEDIRNLKLQSLRNQIGIVQQDVYLFAGTVMENIRYGKPDATDEEVIRAAKAANAHEFITELEQGYDTDIGQRGVKLSGGQKQRLSIARVFLKNPPILIFDEATSALDNESEKIVQQSLENLAKDRTTFVIAHRLSTIRKAQRILVLTEDGIAEEGTHEELMKKEGIYSSLYQLSFA